jgi:hypothetical protein
MVTRKWLALADECRPVAIECAALGGECLALGGNRPSLMRQCRPVTKRD